MGVNRYRWIVVEYHNPLERPHLPNHIHYMYKQVVVETQNGRPDSLKRSVMIAFVVTPDEPNGPSHPYSPVAYDVKTFSANTQKSISVYWEAMFHLRMYTIDAKRAEATGPSTTVFPGQTVAINSLNSWSSPIPHENKSFTIVNKSGSNQNILVAPYHWRIAYDPLENGHSITVPQSWKLQLYIVDAAITELTTLRAEDLLRPLFPVPVHWDALPAASTWMLTEDDNGGIRVHNDQYMPKRDPLSEVLERLSVMEKSIERLQSDYTTVQTVVVDIQNQVSALKDTASTRVETQENRSSIAAVEAKTATLVGSINQSQGLLAQVQEAVSGTQRLLSKVDQKTEDLNRRLPLVESRAEKAVASLTRVSALEESATRTQNHVAAVEKAVHQTQDHVSLVQQMVLAKQAPGEALLGPPSLSRGQAIDQKDQSPQLEARVETLEKSAQDQRKALRAIDRKMPSVGKLETDLALMQALVGGLDRRIGVIEAGLADEGGAASSSAGGSPIMFPNNLADAPPAS